MREVCAWCEKILGSVESEKLDAQHITHSICLSCKRKFYKQLSKPLRDFLDSFDEPILLIGSEPIVLTANKSAQDLLHKELDQIEGYKGGEVINCTYSLTKEGCGKDIHCESCTIRNTVLETFATGKSFLEVPAYPDIQQSDEVKKYCIKISTQKIGEFVLLRIDYMNEMPQIDATDDVPPSRS